MNYFLYTSQSKINMMFEQLRDSSATSVTSTYKLDVKFAGFERQTAEADTPSQYHKLDAVRSHLQESSQICELNLDQFLTGPSYCEDFGRWHAATVAK